jgi:hypothetical protein
MRQEKLWGSGERFHDWRQLEVGSGWIESAEFRFAQAAVAEAEPHRRRNSPKCFLRKASRPQTAKALRGELPPADGQGALEPAGSAVLGNSPYTSRGYHAGADAGAPTSTLGSPRILSRV